MKIHPTLFPPSFLVSWFKILSENSQENCGNHEKYSEQPSPIPSSLLLGLRIRFRKRQYRPEHEELHARSSGRNSPKWMGNYQRNEGRLNLIENEINNNGFKKVKDSFLCWAHSLCVAHVTVDFQKGICQENGERKHDKDSVNVRKSIDQRIDKVGQEGVRLILLGIILASLIAPFNIRLAGYAGACFLSGGLGMRLAAYDLSSL